MRNPVFALNIFATAFAAAAPAWAHTSLVPHDHPHGETWLLGLDAAVIATLAVVALVAVAAFIRSRAARARIRDRKRGRS